MSSTVYDVVAKMIREKKNREIERKMTAIAAGLFDVKSSDCFSWSKKTEIERGMTATTAGLFGFVTNTTQDIKVNVKNQIAKPQRVTITCMNADAIPTCGKRNPITGEYCREPLRHCKGSVAAEIHRPCWCKNGIKEDLHGLHSQDAKQ